MKMRKTEKCRRIVSCTTYENLQNQPREGRQPKPIRQAENEIPVFALFAILANMDPRTMSELIANKKQGKKGKRKKKFVSEKNAA